MKKKPLNNQEKKYIEDNCLLKTDKELSLELKRDVRTISTYRKFLGIEKTQGGKVAALDNITDLSTAKASGRFLLEKERKEFFKLQLKNTLFYDNLKIQFTKDEIDFYLEEWAALCIQFEDIVATEKRQIDELIKAEIMGNRILRNIKIAEDEIQNIEEEINQLRKDFDIQNNEEGQQRDLQLLSIIRVLNSQSEAMGNLYQKNVDSRNKLLNELNARRRDRIDHIKSKNSTVLGLIAAYREREHRESQGNYLELVKLAKENKLEKWRKSTTFPDGTKDCIILDEGSEVNTDQTEHLTKSVDIFDAFSKAKAKNILIIENDHTRQQFFADKFRNNILTFCDNSTKAIDALNTKDYDLICFDYDLNMNSKSEAVAIYILENNKSPNAKALLHTMNEDGAKKLSVLLSGEREFEVCPFETLMSIYKGKENA
jgi:hypothetical protein